MLNSLKGKNCSLHFFKLEVKNESSYRVSYRIALTGEIHTIACMVYSADFLLDKKISEKEKSWQCQLTHWIKDLALNLKAELISLCRWCFLPYKRVTLQPRLDFLFCLCFPGLCTNKSAKIFVCVCEYLANKQVLLKYSQYFKVLNSCFGSHSLSRTNIFLLFALMVQKHCWVKLLVP